MGFYKKNTAVLKLDSTKIDVSTNSFFEKDFSLTDVSGVVKLSLIKESVKYFSDDLVFLKDGEKLKGKFTHFISNDVNDLSISINTSNNIKVCSSHLLTNCFINLQVRARKGSWIYYSLWSIRY